MKPPFESQYKNKEGIQTDTFFFWWERVDSNHRSQRQQIYSLPPLATREFSRTECKRYYTIQEAECQGKNQTFFIFFVFIKRTSPLHRFVISLKRKTLGGQL